MCVENKNIYFADPDTFLNSIGQDIENAKETKLKNDEN